jgi:HEAT repeat protein
MKTRNPKSEIRNKCEIRNPKSETKLRQMLVLGIRISNLFRISDFGFRIWLLAASLALLIGERASAQTPKFLQKTADEWAAQLKSPTASTRRNAAFALGKIGNFSEKALPELKRALRDEKDSRAREAMVWAAGEIVNGLPSNDAELEAMLIESLRHTDKLVRRSAACALGQLASNSDATRAALASALSDKEQIVRQNAAWALGQLDDKAVPLLRQALSDTTSDSLVKRDAANALFTAARADASKMRPAMSDLLRMCSDRDPEVRKAGLVPLVKIVDKKDTQALPVLNKVLRDDPDPEVRRYAALALSNVGGQAAAEAVPVLVDALRNGEPHLKRSAAVALHNVGKVGAPAVPDLVKALQDADPELRKSAALALGGIGPSAAEAVPWLVHMVTDLKQPLEVRVESAEALTGMGNIAAVQGKIPDLLRVLGNPNEDGDLRIRLAWLFNAFVEHRPTMQAAFPVMSKICAEPATKDNGSTRYHCAYLLSIAYRQQAPDAAISVLADWLKDNTGKIYSNKRSSVGAQGLEKKGNAEVQLVLEGDSRIMAVDALRLIGRERIERSGRLNDIIQQLQGLVKDNDTHKELKKEAKRLLDILGR